MAAPALRLRGVRKWFGSVSALEDVRFDAHAGEVHAIVGDNGAGKSTTIKIIAGVHRADEGEVLVNGEELGHVRSAADAQAHGIAVVYQDLALVECLDIAHNMALGNLPRKFGFVLDRRRMEREAAQVLKDLKVRVGN
ncbi:MAG: ATP-binding cassette domain-containing protein, partial [Umezawaea sp.]